MKLRFGSPAIQAIRIGLLSAIAGTALLSSLVYQSLADEGVVRQVHGIVEVVNTVDTPPIIVIRSQTGSKDEIIVGAVIKQGIPIVSGKKRVTVKQIRKGDRVILSYVKNREGLVARSITIQAK